jgi:hypothetical protein
MRVATCSSVGVVLAHVKRGAGGQEEMQVDTRRREVHDPRPVTRVPEPRVVPIKVPTLGAFSLRRVAV